MILEEALTRELMDDSTFSGLATAFYDEANQDVSGDYVTTQKISGVRDHTHQGASGLVRARIQFSIFSSTYIAGKTIAASIASVLDGYSGTMQSSVTVGSCLYEDETDQGYQTNEDLHHLTVDYMIWYKE